MNYKQIIDALIQNGFNHKGESKNTDFLSIFPSRNRVKEFLLEECSNRLYRLLVIYADKNIDVVDEIKETELIPLLLEELTKGKLTEK